MRILFLLLIFLGIPCAWAQSDLPVAPYFKKGPGVASVAPARLAPYDLKHYVQATLTDVDIPALEAAVTATGRDCQHSEVAMANGSIAYAFYELPRLYGLNRYLLYLNRLESRGDVTLIYLAGDASLPQVFKLFKHTSPIHNK